MKKIFSFILVFISLVILAGCGLITTETPTVTEAPATTVTEAPVVTTTTTEEVTTTTEEATTTTLSPEQEKELSDACKAALQSAVLTDLASSDDTAVSLTFTAEIGFTMSNEIVAVESEATAVQNLAAELKLTITVELDTVALTALIAVKAEPIIFATDIEGSEGIVYIINLIFEDDDTNDVLDNSIEAYLYYEDGNIYLHASKEISQLMMFLSLEEAPSEEEITEIMTNSADINYVANIADILAPVEPAEGATEEEIQTITEENSIKAEILAEINSALEELSGKTIGDAYALVDSAIGKFGVITENGTIDEENLISLVSYLAFPYEEQTDEDGNTIVDDGGNPIDFNAEDRAQFVGLAELIVAYLDETVVYSSVETEEGTVYSISFPETDLTQLVLNEVTGVTLADVLFGDNGLQYLIIAVESSATIDASGKLTSVSVDITFSGENQWEDTLTDESDVEYAVNEDMKIDASASFGLVIVDHSLFTLDESVEFTSLSLEMIEAIVNSIQK